MSTDGTHPKLSLEAAASYLRESFGWQQHGLTQIAPVVLFLVNG
jgi:hypothetical protein